MLRSGRARSLALGQATSRGGFDGRFQTRLSHRACAAGMAEKSKEFAEVGAEVYVKS